MSTLQTSHKYKNPRGYRFFFLSQTMGFIPNPCPFSRNKIKENKIKKTLKYNFPIYYYVIIKKENVVLYNCSSLLGSPNKPSPSPSIKTTESRSSAGTNFEKFFPIFVSQNLRNSVNAFGLITTGIISFVAVNVTGCMCF